MAFICSIKSSELYVMNNLALLIDSIHLFYLRNIYLLRLVYIL